MSAVGAGDSFLGGMVWALAAGQPIEQAFRVGVAAGSAAVMSPGTELCSEVEVMRLLRGGSDRGDRGAAESSEGWSGRRESNPRMQLGKLPFYH